MQRFTEKNKTELYIEIISEFQSGKTSRVEIFNEDESHAFSFFYEDAESIEVIRKKNEHGKIVEGINYYFDLKNMHEASKWSKAIHELCREGFYIDGLHPDAEPKRKVGFVSDENQSEE